MDRNVTIFHGFDLVDLSDGSMPGAPLEERMPFLLGSKEWKPADGYRKAYTYEATGPLGDLDAIYRENNTVEGPSVNQDHESRSLSVGDVVFIHAFAAGDWWAVMPLGFQRIEGKEVIARLV